MKLTDSRYARETARRVVAGLGKPEGDAVDHPPHYNAHPAGVECVDVVEHMTFNLGNAVKYVWRNGLKPGATAIEDLKKARWYIEREIARLEKKP